MMDERLIGTCKCIVTEDGTLTISPAEGETGWLYLSTTCLWPWGNEIRKIHINGHIKAEGDISCMFDGCSQLEDISELANVDVSDVTNVAYMFRGCSRLKDLSPLAGWDVSNVTTMNNAFEECVSLEDISPLSGWNVERVISMRQMFEGCVSVTNADAVRNWDIKRLDTADNMFRNTGIKENPLWQKVPMACPEAGSFTAWKRCHNGMMVKLLVPGNARRSSAFNEKCRCDRALVLQIFGENDAPAKTAASIHDPGFIYRIGETVSVPDFDPDRFNECAAGIHFFMKRNDAEAY